MNQTQVQNFLQCLAKIDDFNYLALHYNQNHNDENLKENGTIVGGWKGAAHDNDHDHDHEHDHDHDHDHDHSEGSELLTAKVTAMVVLFMASTLCGSIPFLLNRCFQWNKNVQEDARSGRIIKSLLYFGGGVLICTTFLHLLPEVQEAVEHLQDCGTISSLSFPLAETLMCSGFFLMYFIEEIIHLIIHKNKKALEENETEVGVFERRFSSRRSYDSTRKSSNHNNNNNNNNNNDQLNQSSNETPYSPYNLAEKIPVPVPVHTQDLEKQNFHHSCLAKHIGQPYPQNKHSHLDLSKNPALNEKSMMSASLRGFLIVLALSLHELFEGMAIGLEGSSSSVWFMFGAVSAHKLVLAFCVAIELIVARTKTYLSIIYIVTFAIVSPLGIGLGILISNNDTGSSAHNLPAVFLQGLACGTLLYVVIFEILSKNEGGILAYFALLAGFLVMFGLQQLGTHGHGHSHGGCLPHAHEEALLSSSLTKSSEGAHNEHVENFEQKLQQLRHASEVLLAKTVKE